MNVGQKIRDRRKALGLSQRELATRLGVSFQAVQRWEKGQTFPRKETLPKLLGNLQVGADWLVGTPSVLPFDLSLIPPDVLAAVRDPRVDSQIKRS